MAVYPMENVVRAVAVDKAEGSVPMFHCGTCGGSTPLADAHKGLHRCHLTSRQRQRLVASQRDQAAERQRKEQERAAARPTWTCNACDETYPWPLAEPHRCPNSEGARAVALLRSAGYQLVPLD